MNEQGVAAYIGCYQSPVGIAASQAAAKYNTPFLIDVGASDLLVTRGLKNIFRIKPGFGACVDQGISLLGDLNKKANGVTKSAVIVHESGEFGTGTAKLLAGKLPGIGIQVKEVIGHDNPTRNFDNIALRIRSAAPDIVMMSNYQNEYVLLARTLYQQKVNLAAMYSILGGGFNYKFAKEQPDVSQYMIDVNHWYNPKSEKALALKKRVEAAGKEFTFEVYLAYTVVDLLADSLEHAGSADKEKLTAALNASTFKAELMPYGPTKFVNGQNEGGRAEVMQAFKGDIKVIAPEQFAEMQPVFPKPKFT
jgi:branched-chain amino acid transport system substrate-binding protein